MATRGCVQQCTQACTLSRTATAYRPLLTLPTTLCPTRTHQKGSKARVHSASVPDTSRSWSNTAPSLSPNLTVQDVDSGHHGSGFPLPLWRRHLLEQFLTRQVAAAGGTGTVDLPGYSNGGLIGYEWPGCCNQTALC